MVKGFFYIFGKDGNTDEGEIIGVPGECKGSVFMGFCKPDIRSNIQKNDWIIGISNAKLKPRKILSIIEVKGKPELWEAIINYPEAIWSKKNPKGQIYVKAKKIGNSYEYEYINGAPHNETHRFNDLEKYPNTDRLIVGTSNSMILGKYGNLVDRNILTILRKDSKLKNKKIDINAPLGRDKRGNAQGRPKPAVVLLSKSGVKYLKEIVSNARNQMKKSKRISFRKLKCRGC